MKLISTPLWSGARPFPLTPVADILEQIPNWFHLILFWSSLYCMMIFIVFKIKRVLWIVLIAEIVSCMLDQSRWQPWEYQNILMIGCCLFLNREKQMITALQISMAGIYFFSGLSKFHAAFIHDIWLRMILNKWLHIHTNNIILIRMGYALALIEVAAATGLYFNRWRKTAMITLIVMHCFILIMLGPWGINFNKVVWPWNLVMIWLLFKLFYKNQLAPECLFFKQPFAWVIIACYCILPFLGLINRWDHYLSFNLYSGGLRQLYICTDDAIVKQQLGKYLINTSNSPIPCPQSISSFSWAMSTTNTPGYPEQRVFVSIAKYIQKKFPGADVKFYLYTPGFRAQVEALQLTNNREH